MVKIGLTYPSADVIQRYRKWWKGKYLKDGQRIVAVHWYGPPSGFYGEVEIELDDGDGATTDPLNDDTDGDGLLDGEEDANKNGQIDNGETNPNDEDTDGDGYSDSEDAFPLDPERWADLIGDVNEDNEVNMLDLIATRNALDTQPGDPNYNENADVNGDSAINILDLIIIRNNFT